MQSPIPLSSLVRFLPLLAVGFVAGCNSSGTLAPAGSGGPTGATTSTLTIATPHSAEIEGEFGAMWAKKHPDVALKWLSGNTADQLRMVTTQFADRTPAQGIGVDLFFGGGGETFDALEKANLLQKLTSTYNVPAELNGVPLRSATGKWVAAALSGFGILYNKQIAARDYLPVPSNWAGLADPKLQDRIELADARHSGSAHAAYEIILQSNGWDQGWRILTGMAGNAHRFATGSTETLSDVGNGEAVFTPAIDFYGRAAIDRAGTDKLGYLEPKGQYVVTCDPIAMLQGAPNPKAAKEFIDMVMSPEGQKLWYLKKGTPGGPQFHTLFRMPAIPSAYQPIPANSVVTTDPFANKNTAPYDAAKAGLRRNVLDDLMGTVLVDDLASVQTAWKKNPNLAVTGFVPVSEAEAMKLAPQWKNPEVVASTKAAWAAAAEKHFAG